MQFTGKYLGRVVSTADPLRVGRILVRVPTLHGIEDSLAGIISDADLPWATAGGMPAGGSPESGGQSWIPVKGDQVWIKFLDGDLDKPTWKWATQSVPQSKTFGLLPLHAYDEAGEAVRRSAFTRFRHWWEILPDRHSIWTKSQYFFDVVDEKTPGQPSGHFSWTTALSHLLMLDDSVETLTGKVPHIDWLCEDVQTYASTQTETTTPLAILNVGSVEIGSDYRSFLLDAVTRTPRGFQASFNSLGLNVLGNFIISATSIHITRSGISYGSDDLAQEPSGDDTGFSVNGDEVRLGYKASDPLVRLSDLVAALKEVKKQFDEHRHRDVDTGHGVSGIPQKPLAPTATGSTKVLVEPTTSTPGNFK